jgi:hypothetical protein
MSMFWGLSNQAWLRSFLVPPLEPVLLAMPLSSAFGRMMAHPTRSRYP